MQTLVKILESADIGELNEQNIEEYVQATRSVDMYRGLVSEPFDAKMIEEDAIISGDGVKAQVHKEHKQKYMTASQILTTLEMTLQTALLHQSNGQQMYGVKAFDGVVAMDAAYLQEQMKLWQQIPIGTTEQVAVVVEGSNLEEIAKQHSPRLALLDRALSFEQGITKDHLNLYVAAKKQEKDITKYVIGKFLQAFRGAARKEAARTVFDRKEYGGLIVQVKSVARKECDYGVIVDAVKDQLHAVQKGEALGASFYNDRLLQPRMYASIPGLLERINEGKQVTKTKYRQEVLVLYRPSEAKILQC